MNKKVLFSISPDRLSKSTKFTLFFPVNNYMARSSLGSIGVTNGQSNNMGAFSVEKKSFKNPISQQVWNVNKWQTYNNEKKMKIQGKSIRINVDNSNKKK